MVYWGSLGLFRLGRAVRLCYRLCLYGWLWPVDLLGSIWAYQGSAGFTTLRFGLLGVGVMGNGGLSVPFQGLLGFRRHGVEDLAW